MLLSLVAMSDPVGDYSFAYIMTKRGSRNGKGSFKIVVAIVLVGENIH